MMKSFDTFGGASGWGAIVPIFNTHFKEYSTRGDTYFPKSRLTRSRVHRYLGFVLRVGKLF